MAAVDKGSGKSEKITITNDKGAPRHALPLPDLACMICLADCAHAAVHAYRAGWLSSATWGQWQVAGCR